MQNAYQEKELKLRLVTYHSTQIKPMNSKGLKKPISQKKPTQITEMQKAFTHETDLSSLKMNGGFHIPGLLIFPLVVNLKFKNHRVFNSVPL